MPWSNKKIEDAILEARKSNAIFVVYITDDNNKRSLENVLQSPEVVELLSSDRIVAIRIGSNSQSFKCFQNIYQLVPVPSIFFIGENGWPLEIVTSDLSFETALPRIRRLIQELEDSEEERLLVLTAGTSVSATAGTSRQFVKAQTTALSNESEQSDSATHDSKPVVCKSAVDENELKPATSQTGSLISIYEATSRESTESVCPPEFSDSAIASKKSKTSEAQENETSNQACTHSSTPEDTTRPVPQSSEGASIKREYQVQMMRIRPRPVFNPPRTAPEPQLETHGQGIVPLDGRSGNPPAPGILDHIGGWVRNVLYGGRPKTLRACQEAAGKRNEASRVPLIHSNEMEDEAGWPREARIQFRLPDGSTHSESFSSTATIQELREYVQNRISLPFRSFSLSTSYPRLEFTSEHDNTPIGALGLAPRSVILIIPGSQISQHSGLTVQTLWTMIVWPFSAIYSFFVMLNVWLFSRDPANDGTISPSQSRAGQQSESDTSPQSSQSNTSEARRNGPTSSSIHRDGNVHRLLNRPDDSDEDNNTWNGNSTQQM